MVPLHPPATTSTGPLSASTSRQHASEGQDEEDAGSDDDMLLEMLSAAQYQSGGGDGDTTSKGGDGPDQNGNEMADSDHSANEDEEQYNVYDTLRKEELNRNSMMRFKIQR